MKTNPKLILLHKTTTSHHSWLLLFLLFFILTFTYTLTSTKTTTNTKTFPKQTSKKLPKQIQETLLYYATTNTTTPQMSKTEVNYISKTINKCKTPCNFLIFGITHETLLWNTLNSNGRTVFIDERPHIVSKFENEYPYIEAYDVQYQTKSSELYELVEYYKTEVKAECRPVQNLLFSECKLAINELPNHVYEVDWDVILVDGPRGYNGDSPGRAMPIFTAGVFARSRREGGETHVLVHEFGREVESVCSEEFLCKENLVEVRESLGHFVVGKLDKSGNRFGFCYNHGLV